MSLFRNELREFNFASIEMHIDPNGSPIGGAAIDRVVSVCSVIRDYPGSVSTNSLAPDDGHKCRTSLQ